MRNKTAAPPREADIYFMSKALALGAKGEGSTSPNPMVGAVVVKHGRIIGAGYHRYAGSAHAEIEAIREAGSSAQGATLYVSLEPCSTFGRTPPCTDAIIGAGIARIVVAAIDPNPRHSGKGLSILSRAGIDVTRGVLEREAAALNRVFNKFITTGMPWITVKAAMTLDGRLATRSGDSKWITCENSRAYVHRMRGRHDAVLVGRNTVLRDDPLLTVRRNGRAAPKQPRRVVVDETCEIPPGAAIFKTGAGVIVATTAKAPAGRAAALARRGAEVITVKEKNGQVNLRDLLRKLARAEISSVMVEGGPQIITSLFEGRLVDKLTVFIAPKLIGGDNAPALIGGKGIQLMKNAVSLSDITFKRFGGDIMIEGYPQFREKE